MHAVVWPICTCCFAALVQVFLASSVVFAEDIVFLASSH